jgi:[ribosomal protein S5]-alanine N-acetyltransferase
MRAFDLTAFDAPLKVPVLRAGPAVLRPFRDSDLSLIRQAADDPYIPSVTSVPAVYSDHEGRAFIARQHERASGGHGYSFAIAPGSEDECAVGSVGLWLSEIDSGRASIGYWLAPSARGRGLARSALQGVVRFAFGDLGIPRLHLFIEPWNVASRATAEAAGFTQEALLRGWERVEDQQRDALSYAQLLEEWNDGKTSS